MEYRTGNFPPSRHLWLEAVEYRNFEAYPGTASLLLVVYASVLVVLVVACYGGILSINSASAGIARCLCSRYIFLATIVVIVATTNLSLLLRERQWVSGKGCLVDSSLIPMKMITWSSQNISERLT